MSEKLLSVGLDVGTTSTQMVISELTIENRAGSFAVPEMEIARRSIRYRSPVHFTPLIRGELVDADGLRRIVDREYEQAGIQKSDVDTGAIIITGETSRKENARIVLEALSDYAGDFVVATAGPDLESVLAAKGAGAVDYSAKTGKTVLHMDIGGGTSNLALIEDGVITSTGCLNVGGRLLKIDPDGRLSYVSPVLEGLFSKKSGDYVNREEVLELARKLVQALEMAAGLRKEDAMLVLLSTKEIATPVRALARNDMENLTISFSGGVADCIDTEQRYGAGAGPGHPGKQALQGRICTGAGDHPRYGHRCRKSQRTAVREYSFLSEHQFSAEEFAGSPGNFPLGAAGWARGAGHAGDGVSRILAGGQTGGGIGTGLPGRNPDPCAGGRYGQGAGQRHRSPAAGQMLSVH